MVTRINIKVNATKQSQKFAARSQKWEKLSSPPLSLSLSLSLCLLASGAVVLSAIETVGCRPPAAHAGHQLVWYNYHIVVWLSANEICVCVMRLWRNCDGKCNPVMLSCRSSHHPTRKCDEHDEVNTWHFPNSTFFTNPFPNSTFSINPFPNSTFSTNRFEEHLHPQQKNGMYTKFLAITILCLDSL
jgi:hypothetical protein